MQISDLRLSGLKLFKPRLFRDARGFFFESYRQPLYAEAGVDVSFVQENTSFSYRGTVRGLHFSNQSKLVSCPYGKIWDVAVDIRPTSSTFGKWEAVQLDDVSHLQLFLPVGFAHGYCALSETALVQYKVSALYDPELERSIRWDDPTLAIAWPIDAPILSERDRKSPFFKELFP